MCLKLIPEGQMYEIFWDYNLKLQKMLNIEWQVDCKTSGDLKLMPGMVKVTKFQTILMSPHEKLYC